MPEPRRGFLVYNVFSEPGVCDDRKVVLMVGLHQSVWMNGNLIERAKLSGTLREIFQTRAGQFLYLGADPAVPFQDFVRLLDTLHGEFPSLQVAIIPSVIDWYSCLVTSAPLPL